MTEILPGECVATLDGGATRAFLWHPAEFCRNAVENSVEAMQMLREATFASVTAWASCYARIVHELSGGLDSSIVLGCLSRAPVRSDLLCLNVFTGRPEGDERTFARASAAAAGVPLVEAEIRASQTTLKRMQSIPRMARPHISAIGLVLDEAYTDLARKHRAEAFFSGQGGDHLFYQRKTSLVAADYLRGHGPDRRFLSVLGASARASGQSAWQACATAVVNGLLPRGAARHTGPNRRSGFLDPDALSAVDDAYLLHPWLPDCRDVPPAKLLHVDDLVNLQTYYFSFGRAACADLVFPLFSQPIMEVCLRIPTYILTEGGRDRALARRAFADIVPDCVLNRQTKGDITSFYNALLIRDLDFARELLLDGLLVREGLLDRVRLESYLTEDHALRGGRLVDILICLGVELWARKWADARMAG